jgi:hypothetical protein
MKKGKRKDAPPASPEGIAPTLERWRRGDVELAPNTIADEAGRPARPYRTQGPIDIMLRKGTITAPMRQAAEDFHALFVRAALDPLRVPDLRRTRQGGHELDPSVRQEEARKRVWKALAVLGGIASPAGSCVWHVAGCQWNLKEWALREGWGGRPLTPETASGVLVGALGVLQAHFGL